MTINTKYNIGDTVYLVYSYGNKRILTDQMCPCCNGTGEVTLFPHTVGKCNISKSMTVDGHWYYARCENGKISLSRPDYVVRKGTIREIDAFTDHTSIHITYYMDEASETREEYIYATEEEAQAIVDQCNQKTEKILSEL